MWRLPQDADKSGIAGEANLSGEWNETASAIPGLLVSPTEPLSLRALGVTSSYPEQLGVDFAFAAQNGDLVGIQRKEIHDLLASVRDGRLAREVAQMQTLAYRALITEGRVFWTPDGALVGQYGGERWTQEGIWALSMSIQAQGIAVFMTMDTAGTAKCIRTIVSWVGKGTHRSLRTRPKAPKDRWGQRDNKAWAAWLIQAFDGCGPDVADAIVKHFDGLPMQWTCTEKELREVPGVGKLRARRLMEALRAADTV